jgi:hypothetical protein
MLRLGILRDSLQITPAIDAKRGSLLIQSATVGATHVIFSLSLLDFLG